MNLPNAERAIVEREKITDYLLDPAHPDNGGKAPFFEHLGFRLYGLGKAGGRFLEARADCGSGRHNEVATWPQICDSWWS